MMLYMPEDKYTVDVITPSGGFCPLEMAMKYEMRSLYTGSIIMELCKNIARVYCSDW
jgi:hypothetical protein